MCPRIWLPLAVVVVMADITFAGVARIMSPDADSPSILASLGPALGRRELIQDPATAQAAAAAGVAITVPAPGLSTGVRPGFWDSRPATLRKAKRPIRNSALPHVVPAPDSNRDAATTPHGPAAPMTPTREKVYELMQQRLKQRNSASSGRVGMLSALSTTTTADVAAAATPKLVTYQSQAVNVTSRIDRLYAGECMKTPPAGAGYDDACLQSSSGYKLCLNTDGTLVVYNTTNSATASLSTGLAAADLPFSLCLERDGGLYSYDKNGASSKKVVSSPSGSGPYAAYMQDNGVFAVYDRTCSEAIFTTGTQQGGASRPCLAAGSTTQEVKLDMQGVFGLGMFQTNFTTQRCPSGQFIKTVNIGVLDDEFIASIGQFICSGGSSIGEVYGNYTEPGWNILPANATAAFGFQEIDILIDQQGQMINRMVFVPVVESETTYGTVTSYGTAYGTPIQLQCPYGLVIEGIEGSYEPQWPSVYALGVTCGGPACLYPPIGVTGAEFTCSGSVDAGGTCSGACKDNFIGDVTATCTVFGTWSVDNKCQKACPAAELPGQPNASWGVCAAAVNGSTCTATCDAGYKGSNGTATCGASGWTITTVPACTLIVCNGLPGSNVLGATWAATCAGKVYGSVCTASCGTGYSGISYTSICGANGWSSASGYCYPDCSAKSLPSPGSPFSGYWPATCSLKFNSTCSTACRAGYTGGMRTTCGINGGWSKVTGSCTRPPADPCVAKPCAAVASSTGVCTTLPGNSGYTCGCTSGASWNSSSLVCTDTNGCANNPCQAVTNSNGTCRDVPAPGTGFTCSCNSLFTWNGTACVGGGPAMPPMMSCPAAYRPGTFPGLGRRLMKAPPLETPQQQTSSTPQTMPPKNQPVVLLAARGAQRKLLQAQTQTTTPTVNTSSEVYIGDLCPPAPGGLFKDLSNAEYGDLAADNGICQNQSTAPLTGIAAQDFVSGPFQNFSARAWSSFTTADPGTGATSVVLQGLMVAIVGNVGVGHPASSTCVLNAASVDIYTADSSTGEPTDLVHSAYVSLAPGSTFTWAKNESVIVAFDIADGGPVYLPVNSTLWLRLQLVAPVGGDNGNGTCHALLGTSSSALYPQRPMRWQESGGYGSSCLGAATASVPGSTQTAAACLNGGAPGATGNNFCQNKILASNTCNPVQVCPAAPLDLVYGFYGRQGLAAIAGGD